MPTLPNKEELQLIRTAVADAAGGPDLEAEMVLRFQRGEFTAETIDSALVVIRAEAPELFTSKKPADDAAISELAEQAFVGRNATARRKLFQQVGEAKADELAKQYGLAGFKDFATRGVAPDKGGDTSGDAEYSLCVCNL